MSLKGAGPSAGCSLKEFSGHQWSISQGDESGTPTTAVHLRGYGPKCAQAKLLASLSHPNSAAVHSLLFWDTRCPTAGTPDGYRPQMGFRWSVWKTICPPTTFIMTGRSSQSRCSETPRKSPPPEQPGPPACPVQSCPADLHRHFGKHPTSWMSTKPPCSRSSRRLP